MKETTNTSENSQELACILDALTKSEFEEAMAISKEIFSTTNRIQELEDGYALYFQDTTNELIAKLSRFATLDSLCCPFIKHTIEIETHRKETLLLLTGEKKVKAYINGEFEREMPKHIFENINRI